MHQADSNDRDRAYLRIRQLITDGEIDPGVPISERSMADLLGFGRTPVREALKSLARERLIDVVPTRGTFLRQPSLDELRDIFEVRLAIESMAAALVARRTAPPELLAFRERLTGYFGKSDTRAAIAEMHRTGWDFHSAIVAATGNDCMMQTYDSLRPRIMAARTGRPVGADQARRSLVEHIAILDAIESGDAALAQARIGAHLAGVLEARAKIDVSAVRDVTASSIPLPPNLRKSA